ncbi:hypothetical protein PGTUg99_031421 [Puccinia graminis f. sp. tritici]|uniref:Uncharacterized protein n=1 Tax=Puccinia graminis f. sp. tritici TaxID=56615 RepID=A0A5B0LW36_PUCGR|nr:hypothetical protein PGTUg99_031421 [Puccinia graminis f. sp. tritici]
MSLDCPDLANRQTGGARISPRGMTKNQRALQDSSKPNPLPNRTRRTSQQERHRSEERWSREATLIYKRMQAEERYGQEGYKYVGNATYVSRPSESLILIDLSVPMMTHSLFLGTKEPIGYEPPANHPPPIVHQASAPPAYGSAV